MIQGEENSGLIKKSDKTPSFHTSKGLKINEIFLTYMYNYSVNRYESQNLQMSVETTELLCGWLIVWNSIKVTRSLIFDVLDELN